MIISSCQQGSELWFAEKLGKPSASNASKIIQNSGERSKQRVGYLHELSAEIITGRREESYSNQNMLNGTDREDGSRKLYELIHDVEVSKVGVIYKDEQKKFLCSPDGIISGEYGLELKNPLPKTMVKYLLDGEVPSEYFSQIQFSLYVTGFSRWDFMAQADGMRPLIIKVSRDEQFIASLEEELKEFVKDLESIVRKLQQGE